MKGNADVDFDISDDDMETLKNANPIEDYGEHSVFPVYGGTRGMSAKPDGRRTSSSTSL